MALGLADMLGAPASTIILGQFLFVPTEPHDTAVTIQRPEHRELQVRGLPPVPPEYASWKIPDMFPVRAHPWLPEM